MICGRKNKASEYIFASGCRSKLRSLRNKFGQIRTHDQAVSRVIYIYRIVKYFGTIKLNAAAAVAANNTSSATAGQQHTGIILRSKTLRQQLYNRAAQTVIISHGADTRSGRETK